MRFLRHSDISLVAADDIIRNLVVLFYYLGNFFFFFFPSFPVENCCGKVCLKICCLDTKKKAQRTTNGSITAVAVEQVTCQTLAGGVCIGSN